MKTHQGDQNVPSGPYTAQQYTRHPDHTPNTTHEEQQTYILTLHTDPAHHARITALRKQHFPQDLNKLSAHIALFRALPGSQLDTIESDIRTASEHHQRFQIVASRPVLMAHGVGIHVHAPPATIIYEELREKWRPWLSAQDKTFRAHYTVQNKVDQDVALKTLQEVETQLDKDEKGLVDGLTLWRYRKGYWDHVRDFIFEARV